MNAIISMSSRDTGKLMENPVATELMHREKKIYCWKNYIQAEVYFIVKEEDKISELIQVAYSSGRDKIKEREIKGLIKGSRKLNYSNLVIVTYDYEGIE